ncbi:hypothetical protein HJFPF1_09070 [Paramyrothecium foliicola]|nr:hypothetical protein HJFPF1_09070 [Paramyrothecium foliicola]
MDGLVRVTEMQAMADLSDYLNALVFIFIMGLLSSSLSVIDNGKIGLGSHTMMQISREFYLRSEPYTALNSKEPATTTTTITIAAAPVLIKPIIAFNRISLTISVKVAGHYLGMMTVAAAVAGSSSVVHRLLCPAQPSETKSSKSKPPKSGSGHPRKHTFGTIHYCVAAVSALQVIMAKEMLPQPSHSHQGETFVGSQNFREAIRSGPVVPGIIIMLMSIWAVIDLMEGKRGTCSHLDGSQEHHDIKAAPEDGIIPGWKRIGAIGHI